MPLEGEFCKNKQINFKFLKAEKDHVIYLEFVCGFSWYFALCNFDAGVKIRKSKLWLAETCEI